MIYLDNAATTLIKPNEVYKNVSWAIQNLGSPGRGGHAYAMRAAQVAFNCREKAAKLFGVSNPENVVFTLNATHALNIAIFSLVKPGMRVVVSGYEHNSVIRPLYALNAVVDVAQSAVFEPEAAIKAFEMKLKKKTDVVIVNHISNVFGYILPIQQIADICKRRGIPLIIDASQSAGCMEISMENLGAAFIAMPGHKGLYGPQGTGLLLCNAKTKPILHGGSGSNSISYYMPDFLPDRLEAGTHNMPGIAGLSAGLSFVEGQGVQKILKHEQELIALMADGFRNIKGIDAFSSENSNCQAGVMAFNIRGLAPEEAGSQFAERGIALRAGLHCSPLAHKTVGTFPAGTVRASVSAFSSKNDVLRFLNAAEDIARKSKK